MTTKNIIGWILLVLSVGGFVGFGVYLIGWIGTLVTIAITIVGIVILVELIGWLISD